MTLPVDAARAVTNSTTSGTSHSLNLPGSISSGDFLLSVIRTPGSATTSWPSGWIKWEELNADASDDVTTLAFKVADGTEGATITVTLGTSRILVGLCYKVTGAVAITLSNGVVGSASQPNSPNLLASTIARDFLWITLGGCDDSETLTSAPTNYANGTIQGSTATGASGCSVYGASRQLNAASEDPGAWTLGSTSIWTAWTVGFSDVILPSRISQLPTEALVQPDTQKARISQLPTEALVQPNNARARISQLPTEVLVQSVTSKLRLSQMPVEVLRRELREHVHATIID